MWECVSVLMQLLTRLKLVDRMRLVDGFVIEFVQVYL